MTKVYFYNWDESREAIIQFFKNKNISELVKPPDLGNNIFYVKGGAIGGDKHNSQVKIILFVHAKRDSAWLNIAKTDPERIDVVFMSSGTRSVDDGWPANVHACGYPATDLNNDRVNAFFENLESPNWLLLTPEPYSDYLVAARLLFLACSQDDKFVKVFKESIPKFWGEFSSKLPNIQGVPNSWDSFMKMDNNSKQGLDNSLKRGIRSNLCK